MPDHLSALLHHINPCISIIIIIIYHYYRYPATGLWQPIDSKQFLADTSRRCHQSGHQTSLPAVFSERRLTEAYSAWLTALFYPALPWTDFLSADIPKHTRNKDTSTMYLIRRLTQDKTPIGKAHKHNCSQPITGVDMFYTEITIYFTRWWCLR